MTDAYFVEMNDYDVRKRWFFFGFNTIVWSPAINILFIFLKIIRRTECSVYQKTNLHTIAHSAAVSKLNKVNISTAIYI